MALKLANNAASRLTGAITAAATTFSVTPGEGAKFPALDAGDWFPLTLVKSDGSLEIVRCTARSSDTFTVERAQEGTPAIDFAAGDRVELRLTKAVVDAVMNRGNQTGTQPIASVAGLQSALDAEASARASADGALQTALNTKFDKAGGTISGSTVINGLVTLGRIDALREGGQISVCRAVDNLVGHYIDSNGPDELPALRFMRASTSTLPASTPLLITGGGCEKQEGNPNARVATIMILLIFIVYC